MPFQKKTYQGGINSDTDDGLLPANVDRYRLNVRAMSSDNDTVGAIETVNGNTLVSFSLPSGNNTVIGSREDLIRKKVYYFVFNDSSNHSILEFDSVTNAIAKVFQSSILNFEINHLITGINFIEIDATNHLLYWTDFYNEPRKINIEKGKYFMLGDFVNGYKSPFDPEILYRIKQPPLGAPSYIWNNSVSAAPTIQFQATSSTSNFISQVAGPTTIEFETDAGSPADGFDTTTYTWTNKVSGYYQFQSEIQVTSTLASNFTISFYTKNFITGAITELPYSLTQAIGATTTVSPAINISNEYLSKGDTVYMVFTTNTAATTLLVTGTSFSGIFVSANVQGGLNLLFKKNLTFKTQFAYDDNELSSWSPISPYAFPNVTGEFGGDFTNQDNGIMLTVTTGNSIVTKIRVAAKETNAINYYLIAELNKKELGLSDNSTYVLVFYNNGNYIILEVNESNKLFDNVPLKSLAQEIIKGDKIVDGQIVEGFDPVDIDMKFVLTSQSTIVGGSIAISNGSWLKTGGAYQYGIVYYDHANRSGLTNIQKGPSSIVLSSGKYGTALYVPFITAPLYNNVVGSTDSSISNAPKIFWEIYNNPPSWATHYQIVRSKNLAMGRYLQFAAQQVQYVDGSGTPVAPGLATNLYVHIQNISQSYKTAYPNSILTYDFVKGDRIRFIMNSGDTTAFPYNDSPIISYDSTTGLLNIQLTPVLLSPFGIPSVPLNIANGAVYEIYLPQATIIGDNELTFEIGECFNLSNDTHGNLIHEGLIGNQLIANFSASSYSSPNILITLSVGHGITILNLVKVIGNNGFNSYGIVTATTATTATINNTGYTLFGSVTGAGYISKAATGVMRSGDTFRPYQNMPRSGGITQSYVENNNASNMFNSAWADYGRPNRIDPNFKQINRPNTVIYSENFVPETFINGLSTVYDTSFESYETKYGSFQKFYNEQQNLFAFMELKVGFIPVLQNVFSGTQGGSVVGTSTQILSPTMQYYAGEFGIGKNPESFFVYAKAKYFIDVRRGTPVRLSLDGLVAIGNIAFMHNYFTDKCRDVLNSSSKIKIYGVYDIKFKEYIISFSAGTGVTAETVAFNEKENQWSTFYSYIPEGLCSNGIDIISFKNGGLWKHNTGATQNNFYGVQYKSEIWSVLNENPSAIKVLQAVSEETPDIWEVYEIATPSGQLSNLITQDFQIKEGMQYAALWRDQNTPNIANPLFQGDPMRGQTALFKFRYPGTTYSKIFATNLHYQISDRHDGYPQKK